jgi:hypothetical protein
MRFTPIDLHQMAALRVSRALHAGRFPERRVEDFSKIAFDS